MRLEALYKSKKAADKFAKPRHVRQVQQSTSPYGAADRRSELGDEETVHDQQADVEGAQADQPAKTSRGNDGKKGTRHVAAQARQDFGTMRDGDRREDKRESDKKL